MARQPNDGRGRLGGRAKGTPNKPKPLTQALRGYSDEYFARTIPDIEINPDTDPDEIAGAPLVSQFDLDLRMMLPAERVSAMIKIMAYHTPQQRSTTVGIASDDAASSFTQHLRRLTGQE